MVENRPLGGASFVLTLGDCEGLAAAQPGQFVMLRGAWGRDPLLPRAFSILRTTASGGCQILVKNVGRGSGLLALVGPSSELSVLGPLGQRFPPPVPGATDVLVAGGVGLAPLLWHAERAQQVGADVELFYGARTSADLVLLDEIERSGARLHLATEDGSRGVHGLVTRALTEFFVEPRDEVEDIYTCGPNPMMRAVADIARWHKRECLVSVEGEMACGIGACLGCAVPCTDGSRPFRYACVDGPVFDASTIVIP